MRKLKIEKAKRGCRVFLGQEHVKTIPERFSSLIKKKHIKTTQQKRLTTEERFLLEVALFEAKLKKEHPFVFQLIKKSSPKSCRHVTTCHDQEYFELVYKNKHRVKTNHVIFGFCPDKVSIKRNY